MSKNILQELADTWRDDYTPEEFDESGPACLGAMFSEAHARELEYVIEHGELPE